MFRGRPQSIRIFIACFVAGAVIALGYQNCGNVVKDDIVRPSSLPAPFAYSVNADTLGFMTCDKMLSSNDPATFFTMRIAALRTGSGVALNPSFIDFAKFAGKKTNAEIEKFYKKVRAALRSQKSCK